MRTVLPAPASSNSPYHPFRLGIFFASLLPFIISSPVIATDYQQCTLGDTCEIGEFLYDDDYSVYTGATCTLDAKDPAGSAFLSATPLTEAADGWYSYSFDTTGESEGLYRSTICCTAGSDYLCLDKSFELSTTTATSIPTAGEIADAVLDEAVADHTTEGSVGNSLNSISGIAGSVWSYSTRSLSTFGTLVSDFWRHNPTDAEGTPNSAYNELKGQINNNRLALEALLNKPIIKNFLDEGTPPDVKEKIATTRDHTNSLYSLTQSTKSRLASLDKNWQSLTRAELTDELARLLKTLGNEKDSPATNSVVFYTSWLEDAWGNPVTTQANNLGISALTTLKTGFDELEYLGKTNSVHAYITQTLDTIISLEEVVGTVGSSVNDPTLFGHIRKVQLRAQVLDEQDLALKNISSNLEEFSHLELSQALDTQEKSLLAINEFNSPLKVLENRAQDAARSLKNKLYSLQALLDLNKSLLAYGTTDIIRHTWLAEGSVVFRSVITNPSKLLTQKVELKYFLPQELKEEDILDLDPSLTTGYDTTEGTLYVEGSYELAPEEVVIVYLEAEDIWIIKDSDLDNYRTLATDLTDSLKKSTFYGQAVSIKGDIEVALDQVAKNYSDSTPAIRIRTFRENQLTLLTVEEKLAELKNLVNQADSARSITGFVGGSTAIMAWGLLIVILSGFAFLALFIKKSALDKKKSRIVTLASSPSLAKLESKPLPTSTISLEAPSKKPLPWLPLGLGFATLLIIAFVAYTLLNRQPALQAPVEVPQETPTPTPDNEADVAQEPDKIVLGSTKTLTNTLKISDNSSVNLRTGPGTDYEIALSLKSTTDLYIFGIEEDEFGVSWTHVGLSDHDADKGWYLRSDFLE